MDEASKGGVGETVPSRATPLESGTSGRGAQRRPGKRSLGWVQLNVQIPEDLRTRAKIKALQTNTDLSDIVTELLSGWVKKD